MCIVAKKTKTSGSPAAIQVALKKATTEMMVLKLLRERPMYTYEMMSTIEERSGGDIVFNTLYLSIYRLEENGYIQKHEKVMSEDNRTRIYFAITESGSAYLDALIQGYRQYARALARVLELEQEKGGDV
ncbi:PadR family transcriptional regulator [bacterium 1xD42-67]|nr:PadR family transcriptional regulator [bacterium 1xD42-67]